jgi:hypothetical protein
MEQKFYFRAHEGPPDPVLSQMNPAHTLVSNYEPL